MRKSRWVQVGEIGVDAGLVMIGDPCYISDTIPEDKNPKNWDKFCDFVFDNQEAGIVDIEKGTAIVVSSGYGDGSYPVFVKRNEEGRIAEMKVVFISDDEE